MSVRILFASAIVLVLAACRGGEPLTTSEVFPAPGSGGSSSSTLVKSPVKTSSQVYNPDGSDPSLHWMNFEFLNGMRGFTPLLHHDARRSRSYFTPRLVFSYRGRGENLSVESRRKLEAYTRRAFKLWTRHIVSPRPLSRFDFSPNFHYGLFTVVVGGHRCSGAGACAWGGQSPTMFIDDDYLAEYENSISLVGFRTLVHEAGHMLDYDDPTRLGRQPHSSASSEEVMSERWNTRIVPQLNDVRGIVGSYRVEESPFTVDSFGWWAYPRRTTALNYLNVRAVRSLAVDEGYGRFHRGVEADGVIVDANKFSSTVHGTPTTISRFSQPTSRLLGSATWEGALIAVDTWTEAPVRGLARVRSDFSASTLRTTFYDLSSFREEAWRNWRYRSLTYDLVPLNGNPDLYTDGEKVDARFYSEGSGSAADPAGIVAGRLNDRQRWVLGAYAASRN